MPWSQPFWTLPVGLWDEDAYTSQLEPLEPVIDLFKSWFWRLCTSLCLWMCQGLIPNQNSVYYLVCGSWPQYRKTCDLLNLLVVFISPALSDLYCEIAQVLAQREIARRHDAKRVHHSVCLVNSYRPEPYQCLHTSWFELKARVVTSPVDITLPWIQKPVWGSWVEPMPLMPREAWQRFQQSNQANWHGISQSSP